ncbi:MAG TPA: hypothetical protein VIM19_00780 [Actinomycetes bacterium]
MPELVRISVGNHPADSSGLPFNRIAFTFTTAFPSYRFSFTDRLISDPKGQVVPLAGLGPLTVVFTPAQAHTPDGASSTITSQPTRPLGYRPMADYAEAGDFEGVLTYGVGITWPIPHSNPQFLVRAYEVETVAPDGQHQYVVAIDVDATIRSGS